eukprot:8757137-Alexandrium_andersonii.AAC.1
MPERAPNANGGWLAVGVGVNADRYLAWGRAMLGRGRLRDALGASRRRGRGRLCMLCHLLL